MTPRKEYFALVLVIFLRATPFAQISDQDSTLDTLNIESNEKQGEAYRAETSPLFDITEPNCKECRNDTTGLEKQFDGEDEMVKVNRTILEGIWSFLEGIGKLFDSVD